MRSKVRIFSILILLSLGFSIAQAKFKVPSLSGPVIDEVGILNPAQADRLERAMRDFNSAGKAQVQVFITKSLQDLPIEQASIEITDQWKLGDAKKDNGLLFLISPSDKQMRFEIGQGLEGVIPDVVSKRIQTEIIVPLFRNQKMAEGILAGTSKVLELIDQDFMQSHPEIAQDQQVQVSQSRRKSKVPFPVILIIFIIIMILNRFGGGRGGRGGYYGGGFGGGGFGGGGGGWSGGGGGFSGGGSSSSW